MVVIIAGHEFVAGRCSCGRRWLDIRHVDMGYIGEHGYAHKDGLNAIELIRLWQPRKLRATY